MRWWLLASGILLVLLVGARIAAPWLLEKDLDALFGRIPRYDGGLDDVDISVLGGWVALEGVWIERPDGAVSAPFITVERATLRPQLGAWLRGDQVMDLSVEGFVVHYVLGPTEATSQTELDPEWVRELVAHVPMSVDTLAMRGCTLHYHDQAASPDVHVRIDLEGEGYNLANLQKRTEPLFAELELRGRVEEHGTLAAQVDLDPYADPPAFELWSEVRGVPLTSLSDALRAYGRFDAEAGTFSVTTRLVAQGGRFDGVATPEVDDVKVMRLEELGEKRPVLQAAWEVMVGAAAQLAEAVSPGEDEISVDLPIHGEFDDAPALPQILRLLPNAWFGSLTRALGEGAAASEELAKGAAAAAQEADRERADKSRRRDRAAKRAQKERLQ
jgi:hypothetical protein